jgi:hypothetical protein
MMRHLARTRAPLRPFRFEPSDAALGALRARLDETPAVRGDDTFERLVACWRQHDLAAALRRLHELPQFVTELDGAQVHFVHARSPEPGATPLLLTHGALGPLVELHHLLGPLTDPRAYGGRPADAFHVVVPSIPGFGFSGPPPGDAFDSWDLPRVQRAFATLMRRLGYPSFAAHGGDFVAPGPLADEERPAAALADSPRAQLAWTLDLLAARGVAPERIDRDLLLTHVTVGWLTGTAVSSARFVVENAPGGTPASAACAVPPAGELPGFFRHPR